MALFLKSEFIHRVKAANQVSELYSSLQGAIELEHSTIPPYLTAMFSFKPQTEREIWGIIHSIVVEEMLHMTIVSNILNALGGAPVINACKVVPDYPSPLPMNIDEGLIVNLAAYSATQLQTFMSIEEPEHPLEIPRDLSESPKYTIGMFYKALQDQIQLIAPDMLPGDPAKQVTSSFFSADELFPILTKNDALRAIDIIVEQGEGTSVLPLNEDGGIAHYYLFEELYVGRKMVADPSAPNGYSYTGAPIACNPANVYPLRPNTKTADYAIGTLQRQRIDEFNTVYKALLNCLHDTFNGRPERLKDSFGLMFDIKLFGEKLCALPDTINPSYNLGPTFEWIPD
jgi:hypothetical protein